MEIYVKEVRMNSRPTVEEMNEYGYLWDGMIPISLTEAIELWKEGSRTVYLLYPDDTEGMAESLEEIESHGYMFGIEKGDIKNE